MNCGLMYMIRILTRKGLIVNLLTPFFYLFSLKGHVLNYPINLVCLSYRMVMHHLRFRQTLYTTCYNVCKSMWPLPCTLYTVANIKSLMMNSNNVLG